jgi:hypothetical protein
MREFKYTDVTSINKWLHAQGHPLVSYWDLPKMGFIIPGVCAGFVRQVEGNYGILDGLVSNPLVSAKTRHKAMDSLFTQLIAKSPPKMIGTTIDKGTFSRAVAHGFVPSNYIYLTRQGSK